MQLTGNGEVAATVTLGTLANRGGGEGSPHSDKLEGEGPGCGAGHLDAVLDALNLLLPLGPCVAVGALEPLPALGFLITAPTRHRLRLRRRYRRQDGYWWARRRQAPHERGRRRQPHRHVAKARSAAAAFRSPD